MDHLQKPLDEMTSSTYDMQAGASKGQFASLAHKANQLLQEVGLHGVSRTVETVDTILDFTSWLRDLGTYIEKQKTYDLGKLLINKAERLAKIDEYNGRLATIISNLLTPHTIRRSFGSLNKAFDDARQEDQAALDRYLTALGRNKKSKLQELGFDGTNALPLKASLQRYIDNNRGSEQEIHFIDTVISYLSLFTLEDCVVDLKPWTITVFEVDIGPLIGAGSLGKVFRGRWKRRDVVIKMLKTKHRILPRAAYVDREMETWSKLHHPNVLPFLGGNTLDNEPFIVLPFLRHQTSRDFIQKYPDCNRLRLLYETSLGLLYLHSKKIIHGNLKGLNILIDNDEKPQLCDYGFAKIRADINSRSPLDPASPAFLGSRNWMAPELLARGELTFQSDIYSFGMTMYEIFADDIPFGYVPMDRFSHLVVEMGLRPTRPEVNDVPQLSDAAWALAQQSWRPSPTNRISLSILSQKLAALLPSSAGDGLSNNAPSMAHARPPVVPSTIALPQASQPIGLE